MIFLNKDILHQAIAYLARREHTQKELVHKLTSKGFERTEVDEVLQFLVENNYQSQFRAAQSIIRNRVARGYGQYYIQNELKQKGISTDVERAAYQDEPVDWYQLIEQTYLKKYQDSTIKDPKDKAKRVRFLQSRGFSFDEIASVLSTS